MELDCQDLYSSINSLELVPIVFCFMLFKRLFFPFLIVKVIRTISKNKEVVTSHLSSCKCWPPQVKHFCLSHLESLQRIKDNNIQQHSIQRQPLTCNSKASSFSLPFVIICLYLHKLFSLLRWSFFFFFQCRTSHFTNSRNKESCQTLESG